MNKLIPDPFIQEVLARNDIVDIIRSRVQLVQRGDSHLARCPFHEEKTPSFNVSHSKQFYYCFGCGAHGNVIGFLMAYEHLGFREAVTQLAGLAGLEMPALQADQEAQTHQNLYQILEQAAQFYRLALRKNPQAIHYLKSRGVSGQIAKNFDLGYAPSSWQELLQNLETTHTRTDLDASGLVVNKKERSFDRFRDRIIFPIHNVKGQIIAFGGRTLGNSQPKYLNSPETVLFHKGSELYGLYQARQNTAKLTELIVVEGYMDVIALHQHGLTCAVATLGTAVTTKQVQKCLRYVNQLVFCFDGDRAGRQAAWKALLISLPLLREGIHIRFLFLSEGEDPDSLVRKIGAQNLLKKIAEAVPLPEVFFNELKAQTPLNSPMGKAHFGQQAAQYLNTMPHGLFRQLMYDQLAKELEIDAAALAELLQPPQPRPQNKDHSPTAQSSAVKPTKQSSSPLTERIIGYLLKVPDLAKEVPFDKVELAETAKESLLARLIHIFQEHPTITIGELLSKLEIETDRQLIAQLAARPHILPVEKMKEEFLGGLLRLNHFEKEQEMLHLVEKAKKSQLNLEEKRKLQILLSTLKNE